MTENRILKNQLEGRLRLTDSERISLAEIGKRLRRKALQEVAQIVRPERNHQGKDNMLLFPAAADRIGSATGKIHTRERLGGLLKFYHREAA
ncbi:MAG: hypothetical protein FJ399_21980 [Verrucomicrobia bacterium]|nr:hypothetical protein [Verrucomicrobiota bacterium]